MTTRVRAALPIAAASAAFALVGCGGGEPSDAPSAQPESTEPETADYELAQVAKLGPRQAVVTLTGRSDGKTTAVVDFYVPRENGAQDDVYPTTIRSGGCQAPGDVQHDLGSLSAGITVKVLESPASELIDSIDSGASAVVIMAPDGRKVAWCGP